MYIKKAGQIHPFCLIKLTLGIQPCTKRKRDRVLRVCSGRTPITFMTETKGQGQDVYLKLVFSSSPLAFFNSNTC